MSTTVDGGVPTGTPPVVVAGGGSELQVAETDPVLDRLHALADGVRQRDADALTEVYELTVDMLAAVATGILRDRERALDVVQDAFLRLVSHGAEIRGDGYAIRAWLVRTTRNRCLDLVRSSAHRREDPRADVPDALAEDDPAGQVLAGEGDPAFAGAFAQLTEDQRTAMVLTHVVGMSGNEVGEVLGRSRAAVYLLLQRAERRMRTLLTDPFDAGPPDRLSPESTTTEER